MVHEIFDGYAVETKYICAISDIFRRASDCYAFRFYSTGSAEMSSLEQTFETKIIAERERARLINAWRKTPYLTSEPIDNETS